MPDEPKDDPKSAKKATAESTVTMRHEFAHYVHRVAIGEEWFDVDAGGAATFPLRLIDAAELAGFRQVA
jgi:hypothetical protein